MRRALPTLLLFVAGIGVVYTVLASIRAEREYTAFVHELSKGGDTRVLESRFRRGWLHSRAETAIEMSGGVGLLFRAGVVALGARDVRSRVGMHMVHEIEHGPLPLARWIWGRFEGRPVLASIRSTLEIDQEAQLALAEVIGKLPPVQARTVVRTRGEAATSFSMPSDFLHAKGEGFSREGRWLGVEGEIEFTDGFRHIVGEARSPGFESRGPERTVEVRDVRWSFDLLGDELPLGRLGLRLGQLDFDYTMAGAPPWVLEGVELETEGRLAAGRFGAKLRASTAAIRLGDDRWGPGSLRLALDDVHGPALRRLRRAGLRLQAERERAEGAKYVAVDLLEALPELLAHPPRLVLEHLQLATEAGPVSARGQLALVAPAASAEPATPGSFVELDVEAQAPAAIVRAVADARARSGLAGEGADPGEDDFDPRADARRDEMLATLRSQGVLVTDAGTARLHWVWRAAGVEATAPAAPAPAKGAARQVSRSAPAPTAPPPSPEAPAARDAAPASPPAAPAP